MLFSLILFLLLSEMDLTDVCWLSKALLADEPAFREEN